MYKNSMSSSYEDIKTYYPVWYRDIKEMDALWRVNGKQLDRIQEGIVGFVDNNFTATADEESIARWERFLYITYDGPRTLEERRMMVQSYFLGNGHIGEKEIKDIVSVFNSSNCTVTFNRGVVGIALTQQEHFILSDCHFVLRKKLPAHLALFYCVVQEVNSNIHSAQYTMTAPKLHIGQRESSDIKVPAGIQRVSFAELAPLVSVGPEYAKQCNTEISLLNGSYSVQKVKPIINHLMRNTAQDNVSVRQGAYSVSAPRINIGIVDAVTGKVESNFKRGSYPAIAPAYVIYPLEAGIQGKSQQITANYLLTYPVLTVYPVELGAQGKQDAFTGSYATIAPLNIIYPVEPGTQSFQQSATVPFAALAPVITVYPFEVGALGETGIIYASTSLQGPTINVNPKED